jgi:pilus assembly protein CpaF
VTWELDQLADGLRRRLADEALNAGGGSADPEVRERVSTLVREHAAPLSEAQQGELVSRVLAGTLGLGPLEPLIADPEIEEIMINGPGVVLVERGGRIESTNVRFSGEEELMHLVERILSPVGRRVDEASPLVDARLDDGSRVNCIIPPLSLDGPVVTIRRFRPSGFDVDALVANRTLNAEGARLLSRCVAGRANLVVSGGTGTGKTTLLNALSRQIAPTERIVTIEDAAELRLQQEHVVRLESRPPNLEGRGEVTIRQLVRNAMRMRPDRVIVGEVRGPEALDMLQALNTGHDGSMTTVHANGAADALRRVETLALMAELGLPHAAVRQQVASAIDVVVHLARQRDGLRHVAEIAEVLSIAGQVGVRSLFLRRDGVFEQVAEPRAGLGSRLAGR